MLILNACHAANPQMLDNGGLVWCLMHADCRAAHLQRGQLVGTLWELHLWRFAHVWSLGASPTRAPRCHSSCGAHWGLELVQVRLSSLLHWTCHWCVGNRKVSFWSAAIFFLFHEFNTVALMPIEATSLPYEFLSICSFAFAAVRAHSTEHGIAIPLPL